MEYSAKSKILHAIEHDSPNELMRIIIEHNASSLIDNAIRYENINLIKEVKSYGISLNQPIEGDITPLVRGIELYLEGKISDKIVKYLIENSNINYVSTGSSYSNVFEAIIRIPGENFTKKNKLLRKLLKLGLDPNIRMCNRKNTGLHLLTIQIWNNLHREKWNTIFGYYKLLKILLRHGADKKLKNSWNFTAIQYAERQSKRRWFNDYELKLTDVKEKLYNEILLLLL
jgi:hypothetical protein